MSLALVADAPRAPLPDSFKVDDLLTEPVRASIYDGLRRGRWIYGWKSNGKHDVYAFWHMHFAGHLKKAKTGAYDCADELKTVCPPVFEIWQHLERRIFNGHTLIRCYANAHAYGIDGTLHTDSEWLPPKMHDDLPTGGEIVTIWLVTHDERAGTDWSKRVIHVVP